ncbi:MULTISPECIES: hypothetical protein [Arenimonas]|uniref:DUF3185 domain-containing protein n=1 Tax=Arenimonas soli TaxID=2269504 RepID=A0ABQ1HIS1_9GAMM|nr:hypothetical protein [Arenimonas soli]GGA79695.1 hypothetical protein GCM10011521_17430 [Arenimonas soli]
MRMPAIIIGVILLVVGGLITAGVFKYDSKETAELGPIELSVTKEKSPPINLGWILLGVGAVAVVIGAASKK